MRMRERDFESVKYASVQDAKDAHSSRMVKIIEHTGDPSTSFPVHLPMQLPVALTETFPSVQVESLFLL